MSVGVEPDRGKPLVLICDLDDLQRVERKQLRRFEVVAPAHTRKRSLLLRAEDLLPAHADDQLIVPDIHRHVLQQVLQTPDIFDVVRIIAMRPFRFQQQYSPFKKHAFVADRFQIFLKFFYSRRHFCHPFLTAIHFLNR